MRGSATLAAPSNSASARAVPPDGALAALEPVARDPAASRSPAIAHLVIRVAFERNCERGRFASLSRRLRTLISADPRALWRSAVGLRIASLGGEVVLALDDAAPLVHVDLPSGRYQVAARWGDRVRSYTMTLAEGESLELQLRFGAARG